MNMGQRIALLVTDAINGAPQAIQTLKALLRKDPSRADPHVFWVGDDRLLYDSLNLREKYRREVLPPFPSFNPRNKYASGTGSVISHVRDYPALVEKLNRMAFARLDYLETQIVVKDRLTRSERSYFQSSIEKITQVDRPLWQQWVLQASESELSSIDRAIQDWLSEPIDWAEKHMFKEGWEDPFYSQRSVIAFFDQIGVEHQVYLGIQTKSFTVKATGKKENFYTLKDSLDIKVANDRATKLGVNFCFEAI
jgi:hypothetical protein